MSEEEKYSDSNSDPVDNNTATQENTTQEPPVQDEDRHGESTDDSSANMSTSQNNETLDKETLIQKREEGKLQQVQKELNEVRQRFQKVTEWAAGDPDRFKEALINTSGYSEEQALQEVQRLQQQGYWQGEQEKNQISQQAPTQQISPDEIIRAAETRVEERLAVKEFFSQVPELAPEVVNKLSEEERQQKIALVDKIDSLSTFLATRDNLTKNEALMKAYKIESGKTDDDIEAARENGRIEGLAQANSNNANISIGSPVAQSKTKSSVRLSPSEAEIANQLGMTPEEYKSLESSSVSSVDN